MVWYHTISYRDTYCTLWNWEKIYPSPIATLSDLNRAWTGPEPGWTRPNQAKCSDTVLIWAFLNGPTFWTIFYSWIILVLGQYTPNQMVRDGLENLDFTCDQEFKFIGAAHANQGWHNTWCMPKHYVDPWHIVGMAAMELACILMHGCKLFWDFKIW